VHEWRVETLVERQLHDEMARWHKRVGRILKNKKHFDEVRQTWLRVDCHQAPAVTWHYWRHVHAQFNSWMVAQYI